MNKLCVLFTLIIAAFTANGQITITRSDMPSAGSSFNYYTIQAVGSGINVNQTGANYTWNFGSLAKEDSVTLKYEPSLQTPYAFFFLNTMGVKIADNLGFGQYSFSDVYTFYKNTNASFTGEGMGIKFNSFPLAANHSDEDEIYKFPLKYGNWDSTTFQVTFQLPVIGTFKQMGSRVTEVDGWGNITLPGGTSSPCLRVKSTIYEIDSIAVTVPFPATFGFPSTRIEYKWLTNNDKVSVLQVTGTEAMGNFVPGTVQYRSKAANNPPPPGPGVSVQEQKTFKVNIYPNPATEKITVNLGNPDAVKLFDMQGKELAVNYSSTQNSTEINTSALAAGFYMLFVKAGNELVWEKVEIK